MDELRQIIFYKFYFQTFYLEQEMIVRKKMNLILSMIKIIENIPEKYFQHIEGTNGLYEIKFEWENNIYKIFCCFEKDDLLVLLFNTLQKKTRRAPKSEIESALKLRNEYFNSKRKSDGQK
jgi:phage-related protein